MSSSRRRAELRAQREAEQEEEQKARYERVRLVYQVPPDAAEAFVDLQDALGDAQADAIAAFVNTMLDVRGERS